MTCLRLFVRGRKLDDFNTIIIVRQAQASVNTQFAKNAEKSLENYGIFPVLFRFRNNNDMWLQGSGQPESGLMDDPHILFCVKNGCETGELETAEGRCSVPRIRLNKIKFLFKRGERRTHGAFTAVAFLRGVPYTEG